MLLLEAVSEEENVNADAPEAALAPLKATLVGLLVQKQECSAQDATATVDAAVLLVKAAAAAQKLSSVLETLLQKDSQNHMWGVLPAAVAKTLVRTVVCCGFFFFFSSENSSRVPC
jgi:hypothetical protein